MILRCVVNHQSSLFCLGDVLTAQVRGSAPVCVCLLLQETGAMQETGANPRLFLPHKTTVLLVVSTCICLTYSFVIHDYS
jgi:hypothetical protein